MNDALDDIEEEEEEEEEDEEEVEEEEAGGGASDFTSRDAAIGELAPQPMVNGFYVTDIRFCFSQQNVRGPRFAAVSFFQIQRTF